MKNFIGILVIVFVATGFKGPGIQFHEDSISSSLTRAGEAGKLVFLSVYAPWCGQCTRMKRRAYSDGKVKEVFDSRFICHAVNGETAEGRILLKKFNIQAYPALLFLEANGDLKKMETGYRSASELLGLADSVLK